MKNGLDKFSFNVKWSNDDDVFVSTVAEFPSIAAHGKTKEEALDEIRDLVAFVLADIEAESPVNR